MSQQDLEQMPKQKETAKKPETQETVEAIAPVNIGAWFNSLQAGVDEVVENYNKKTGTLHSTLQNFKKGPEGISDYFKHFLENNPTGLVQEINGIKQEKVELNGNNTYTHSGVYEFVLNDGNGGRITVPANFTFVWGRDEDDENNWKIIHHHSSKLPSDEQQEKTLSALEIPEGIEGSSLEDLGKDISLYVGEMKVGDDVVRFTIEKDSEGKEIYRHLSYQEK